nr:metal-dependent phosphohydrolase [Cellvibrionaceae bacterium]
MTRIFIYSALILIVAIFAFERFSHDAGYVIISYGGYTYEMTLAFVLFCLVGVYFTVYFFSKLLIKSYDYLASSVSWIAESQSKNAARRTGEGLVHFIEGNWRDAKRNLLSAAKHSDAPLVHYLASAQSAYELGENDETRRLLIQAEKLAPENSLAILLSQARIQVAEKNYEQALENLNRANSQRPHHPVVLDLLRQVYWELKDWRSLMDLMPSLRHAKNMSQEQLAQFEVSLFSAYLNALTEGDIGSRSLDEFQHAWKRLPRSLQANENLLAQYADILLQAKQDDAVEKLLRNALKKHWSSRLVEMYGRVYSTNPGDQMYQAEKWLLEQPDDPALLATLGRFCVRNELWSKAKNYFERSLSESERPEIYAELAQLCSQLG